MPRWSINYTVPIKNPGPILLIFVLIGITLLVAAAAFTYATHRFVAKAVEVPGVVIRLEQKSHVEHRKNNSSRTVAYFHPVIEYQAPDGKRQTLYSSSGSNRPGFYQGQRVVVLVDPSDPDYPLSARIRSFSELWMFPMVLGFIGGTFVFMSSMFWLASKPKRPANKPAGGSTGG